MDPKAYITGVFDRAASTYDRVDVDFFGPMAVELVRRASLNESDTVLDVGCGRGAALFEAAKRARSVTGIDLASTLVELTRREAPPNATVETGDAEEPDFPDGSFDVIMANLVIFFLPDPAKALRNWARLLTPRGRIVFNTFAAEDERFTKAIEQLAKRTSLSRPARNPVFADERAIRKLIEDNGFTGTTEEVAFESRLRDADHWFEWAWSHGGRAVLENIPDEVMPEARAAAQVEIEKARRPSGEIVLTTRMRFTTAVKN